MNRNVFPATLAAAIAFSAPAHAVATYDSLAAWQGAVSSYVEDTDYGANFNDVSSLGLDGGAALDFSSPVNIRTIGSGWATWSGGYTGQVLYTNGQTSLTGTFTSPVSAFGFFSEPNPFAIHSFQLLLSDGSTIGGNFDGNAGAGFLGWTGAGITGFTISSDTDFAFGDFYVGSAVPEPATWLTMIAGFGMVGVAMRRRSAKTAIA